MDLTLKKDDRLRIQNEPISNYRNFIDISKEGFNGLGVTLFSVFQYIEIRKKDDILKVFTFPNKSQKKEADLGVWSDAEVVFSLNKQIMHKD